MGRMRLLSLTGVVAGLMLGMGALTFGASAQAQAPTPEATVEGAFEAWNAGDAEAFMGYFSPDILQSLLELESEPTVEDVAAFIEDTGPVASYEVSDLKLEGGMFTGTVDLQFEIGFSVYERWTFEDTDEGWVVSAVEPISRPIPPGVPTVDMELGEYYFDYNEDAINAADGNFAFAVANVGDEPHEVIVVEITSDESLLNLLLSSPAESEEPPEGIEEVAFGGFFEPGQEGSVIFEDALSPGRYGLLCFVEAPDGTPHAFLGMISEFTVGSGPVAPPAPTVSPGGPITPPNTGDAGLLGAEQSTAGWLVLGLALTLVLGGTVGLVRSRS